MGKQRDLFESLWAGAATTVENHPFMPRFEAEEVADGVLFVSGFANVSAVRAGAGLVLVDAGSLPFAMPLHGLIRAWDRAPVATAVLTHGHVDHVFGLPPFQAEAREQGAAQPRIVAHEAVPARFDRYKLTRGYNGCINSRQFRFDVEWPSEYPYPDVTYRDHLTLDEAGVRLDLHHARGETDDHTWAYLPDREVLFTGDLFIWAFPNAGNPQKVQRYPREWAAALRTMSALGAEVLCPGHGAPIFGADRVREALDDTATALETLVEQTLAKMNEGAPLDEILRSVKVPERLLQRPYLRPIYDEPEFVVRNIFRLYGGWYDGNPAHLKPAPASSIAAEIASLAGGAGKLAARALAVADAGDLPLACELAELAGRAAPGDEGVWKTRAEVYRRRAAAEQSLMARGIYGAAADDAAPTVK